MSIGLGNDIVIGRRIGVRLAGGGGLSGQRVLLDIDLSSDVDDVGDLAIANYFMSRGLLNIIGVGICVTNTYSPGAADAINTYYGHGSIPIGANKGTAFDPNGPGLYAQHLAQNFSNDTETATNAEEIIDMYRRLLAAQADGSVVVISTGPLNILSGLLASVGDEHSALGGGDLVAAKVSELLCVAGRWPAADAEWNVEQDITSANDVATNWPTTITWIGIEMGDTVKVGNGISDNTPVANPVRKAYELTSYATNGREAWALFAMLYAAYGLADDSRTYFTAVRGVGAIDGSTGATTWTDSALGDHYYLVKAQPDYEYQYLFNGWMFWDPGESVPALPEIVVDDEFTDTNGTSLHEHVIAPVNTVGASWSEVFGGDWSIQGNAADVGPVVNFDNSLAVVDPGVADVEVEVEITTPASGEITAGIVVNYQDNDNFWMVSLLKSSTTNAIYLQKRIAGTYTTIGTAAVSGGVQYSTTYRLRAETYGDIIRGVLVGPGTQRLGTITDRELKTATKVGVRMYRKTPADSATDDGSVFNSFWVRPRHA